MNLILAGRYYLLYFLVSIFCVQVNADSLKKFETLQSASLVYIDAADHVLISKNAQQSLIPASTVKVLTALMAIDVWGLNHRFATEFYYQKNTGFLWVKGFADPMLISEEIDLIVEFLAGQGINNLKGVGVDESYFSKDIVIDGRGLSSNPYDAPVSALAANFNSVGLFIENNELSSLENQTPLTELAQQLSSSLPNGKHRINLGLQEYGGRYFAEILIAKLKFANIEVTNKIKKGIVPKEAKLILTYRNSLSLEQIVSAMLKYSNNFIASQIYLNLGVEKFGPPASQLKAKRAVDGYIKDKFHWGRYQLLDGAGLSRNNKLSALQLVDVLRAFENYAHLMPMQNMDIRAKSGTLTGVRTYAGYIKRDEEWGLFAFMANQSLEYRFREKLAEELSRY